MDHLCCPKYITTTQQDFGPIKDFKKRPLSPMVEQKDSALYTGHPFNNLTVNHVQHKTKTWPEAMDWREEYKQFLLRLKMKDERLYHKLFAVSQSDYKTIEQLLKDERATEYGVVYSKNGYVSVRAQKEVYKKPILVDHHDYYTTYSNSYDRLNKESRFKDKPKSVLFHLPWDAGDTARVFRRHFKKYNFTTYFADICLPVLALDDNLLPPVIIDRHDLRKL